MGGFHSGGCCGGSGGGGGGGIHGLSESLKWCRMGLVWFRFDNFLLPQLMRGTFWFSEDEHDMGRERGFI
jgi:hypothetical protein